MMTMGKCKNEKKCPTKKKTNKKIKKRGKVIKPSLTKKKAETFLKFLKVLEKLKKNDLVILSHYLDKDAYNILSECVHNAICSKSIDDKTKDALKKALWSKKSQIRYLADKTKPLSKRKKIIPQIGGNIGLIIGSVLPMIYEFLKSKKII